MHSYRENNKVREKKNISRGFLNSTATVQVSSVSVCMSETFYVRSNVSFHFIIGQHVNSFFLLYKYKTMKYVVSYVFPRGHFMF